MDTNKPSKFHDGSGPMCGSSYDRMISIILDPICYLFYGYHNIEYLMRCYKFRNRSLDPLQKRVKSWRKLGYLASKNKLRLLDSFNYESQTWGALHKAWLGYIIGKNKFELDKMEHYARVIQKLQKELGLEISSFPDLSLDTFEENPESMSEEISEEELNELMVNRDQEDLKALKEEEY